MKNLDRTVLRSFFTNLILWCLVISGLIIISDIFSHFDDFFNKGTTANPVAAIASYYTFFCLRLVDFVLIFVILISALNILINMFRRNEVIALMALGVSPKRILVPIVAAGVFCSAGMCWLRESFIPNRIVKVSAHPDFFTHKNDSVKVIPTYDQWTNLKIDGESIPARGDRIDKPLFTLPAPRGVEPRVLRGGAAVWQSAAPGRSGGYLVRGVPNLTEFFAEGAIDTAGNTRNGAPPPPHSSPEMADEAPPLSSLPGTGNEAGHLPGSLPEEAPGETDLNAFDPESILVYAPGEMPGTAPDECFVVCGVPPGFLAVGEEEWSSYTSTAELIDALRCSSLPYKPLELQSLIHQRIMKPVSDLFPILLALPILFVYKDGNPYKRGAFAALIAALYVGVCYLVSFTGRGNLPPSLCAWLPIILFLPVTFWLFRELENS